MTEPRPTIRTSSYYTLIGPAPDCSSTDHARALEYLTKINEAIVRGGWSEYETIRLKKLKAKWERRAFGKDPRFNLVGTRIGRLKQDQEYSLMPAMAKLRDEEARASRKGQVQDQRRNPERRWIDADQPTRPAKGGNSPDGEIDAVRWDDEVGEIEMPAAPPENSPRQYLIPGQDAKGHSQRIYCRVMPAHHRALAAIERSKAFGFRTQGDLIRWCVDYGIRELTRRGRLPQVISALAQVDAIKEVLTDEQYYMEFQSLFESMSATINKHIASGAEGEAVRVIAMVRHYIEQMQEAYWRQQYMDKLMQQYGPYLDGSRGAHAEFTESE